MDIAHCNQRNCEWNQRPEQWKNDNQKQLWLLQSHAYTSQRPVLVLILSMFWYLLLLSLYMTSSSSYDWKRRLVFAKSLLLTSTGLWHLSNNFWWDVALGFINSRRKAATRYTLWCYNLRKWNRNNRNKSASVGINYKERECRFSYQPTRQRKPSLLLMCSLVEQKLQPGWHCLVPRCLQTSRHNALESSKAVIIIKHHQVSSTIIKHHQSIGVIPTIDIH